MVKRFGWMCWKVVECVLEFAGYGILFSAPVFFLVDLSAKTTKPEVDISTWKDTQGRGRRVVQLAEAARETQTGCIWLLYLGSLQACQGHVPQDLWISYEFLILRWYGDPTWMTPVKTANKKWVIVPKLQSLMFCWFSVLRSCLPATPKWKTTTLGKRTHGISHGGLAVANQVDENDIVYLRPWFDLMTWAPSSTGRIWIV